MKYFIKQIWVCGSRHIGGFSCSLPTIFITLRWRFPEFTAKSFHPAPDALAKPTCPGTETTEGPLSQRQRKLAENICSISFRPGCFYFEGKLCTSRKQLSQFLTCHTPGRSKNVIIGEKNDLKLFLKSSQSCVSSVFCHIFQLCKSFWYMSASRHSQFVHVLVKREGPALRQR